MSEKISVCGSDCAVCKYLKASKCSGCSDVKGKVFWAEHISAEVCPIYDCVINTKKLKNCGFCSDVPCKLWRDIRDPSYTDEQFEAVIKIRVENLKINE